MDRHERASRSCASRCRLHALPPRAPRRGSGGRGVRRAAFRDFRRSRESPPRAEGDPRHAHGRPLTRRRAIAAACSALALGAACRKSGPAALSSTGPPDDRGVVTLERVTGRISAESKSPADFTLPRGTALKVREARGDAVHVVAEGRDVWIPADSFERMTDREAREKRAAAVAGFAPQPARRRSRGRAGSGRTRRRARWGTLDDLSLIHI